MNDFMYGFWAGFFVTFITVIFINFATFTQTYLVHSDGAVVQMVEEYHTRGECLEKIEKMMKDGPTKTLYQCVDLK